MKGRKSRRRKGKGRFRFRIIRRKTPKGKYTRILIGRKVIFGKNEHEFKGKMTKHYHIGGKFIKIVTKPKELRGIWIYNRKRRDYVRTQRIRKKRKGNRGKNKGI